MVRIMVRVGVRLRARGRGRVRVGVRVRVRVRVRVKVRAAQRRAAGAECAEEASDLLARCDAQIAHVHLLQRGEGSG